MNTCPWCGKPSQKSYLKLKDYFLTQEDFEIFECDHCHLLFTVPRPDPDHIGAYYQSEAYYSHQENSKGFIPKIYEMVKTINLKHKVSLATEGMAKGSLLDIGCGVGDFLMQVKRIGWDITGIEPSENAKPIAEKRLGFRPLDPSFSSSLETGSFDVITLWHVLEHVDDLQTQISEFSRLLKPGGRLVLALPNYLSYDADYYRDKWAAWDVPRHLNHFSPFAISTIFSETDLEIVDIQKLRWDAYYISFLSEKYLGHGMPLVRGLFKGMKSNRLARVSGNYSSMVYILKKN